MFRTNYDTSSDKFQNYYKDVSLRMKNKELDILIVVNMFLTGFDATTMNTLWVDKNLKMHGLIRQIEINIDYILMLVKKYHDTHCEDKEVLITIHKAIDASPELRSKKQLIENFIAGINDVDDVMNEWHSYVVEQRAQELDAIIAAEKLKPEETRKFMENAFRDGEIKTLSMVAESKTPYGEKS